LKCENNQLNFFIAVREMCRIKSRLKIGLRESKNTKNYTGSLFLKGYIQSLCQLAKKFTQEHQVQAIQYTNTCTLQEYPSTPCRERNYTVQNPTTLLQM